MISHTEDGLMDAPSSFGLYKIGILKGSPLVNYTHYSINIIEFDSTEEAKNEVKAGRIDVFAYTSEESIRFEYEKNPKAYSALKRMKQVIIGKTRDLIFEMADVNESLDGILLPVKIKTKEFEIDYDNLRDPTISRNRIRHIDQDSIITGDPSIDGINILDIEQVKKLNISQYLSENEPDEIVEEDGDDDVGFTLPEEWEIPFAFKSIYQNMAVVSVSILLSILLTLSFARERVRKTGWTLFSAPIRSFDILAGKSLPYLSIMVLTNLTYGFYLAEGLDVLKVFYIFTVISVTLISFALFSVMASKNYRELTFMSTLSLLSFLLFIVLPNIFSGVNVLAFISPLDTITSIENNGVVTMMDVFLSMLPYKFLCAFFLGFSIVSFNAETFFGTPSLEKLFERFYYNLSLHMKHKFLYIIVSVSLLVPFVFIIQSVSAYLIMPLGIIAPYMSIFLLAMIEEVTKIVPYFYRREIKPWAYGLVSGLSFFLTEKAFNLYLISKVYSYLPHPYTMFVVKGMFYTMIVHIVTTSFLAFIIHRFRSKKMFVLGILTTTLAHFIYNFILMQGGLFR